VAGRSPSDTYWRRPRSGHRPSQIRWPSASGKAVHAGLGELRTVVRVLDRAREGDKAAPRVAEFGEVVAHLDGEADGVKPIAGDDHCLGSTANATLNVGAEVIDHDAGLAPYRAAVVVDKLFKQALSLHLVDRGVVLGLVEQIKDAGRSSCSCEARRG